MRRHRVLARRFVVVSSLVLAAGAAAACAGGGTGIASAQAADALIRMEMNDMGVTVENKTGTSLVSGQVSIITAGTRPPFFAVISRIGNNERRTFPLDTFRTGDGTQFRKGIARARTFSWERAATRVLQIYGEAGRA